MIKECIILAGGLGTRLRSQVSDLPKCMAPVAGKPFIHWVLANLLQQQVQRFIFSVGYLHLAIEKYITQTYPQLNTIFSVEEEPLGTGGAIQLALPLCKQENVLILNGDTLFEISNDALFSLHQQSKAACTIALKEMQHFDRYGSVTINEQYQITAFEEKKLMQKGLINGGVYLLNKAAFLKNNFPKKLSFEKDYLEKQVSKIKMMAIIENGYFIDIGIPEDFKKANKEIKLKYDASPK